MTPSNTLIRDAIVRALNLECPVFSSEPGYCLRVVREIVENAFGWQGGEFYQRFATDRVEENTGETRWARDLQRSLRNQGLGVPADERAPGDLAFNHRLAAPQGHVGVLLGFSHMYENTSTKRGVYVDGFNRISHLSEWPYPDEWEFFRLPEP